LVAGESRSLLSVLETGSLVARERRTLLVSGKSRSQLLLSAGKTKRLATTGKTGTLLCVREGTFLRRPKLDLDEVVVGRPFEELLSLVAADEVFELGTRGQH